MDLIEYADSHCHLNYEGLSDKTTEILGRMKKSNVTQGLNVCTTLEESENVLNLAIKNDFLYASVGVHPDNDQNKEPTIKDLIIRGSHKKIVAIGETGLDYFRLKGDLEWQRSRFRVHIRAARELNKPLIIHTRNAPNDTINILKEENAEDVGGVMHCFTESLEVAKKAIDMNFLISISGIVTFKKAEQVQYVARNVDLNNMMIETDSPFLAPVPFRGKINEPSYVVHVANKIAELKGISVKQVADMTMENFRNFIKYSN
jgi:TatD DNase family protein